MGEAVRQARAEDRAGLQGAARAAAVRIPAPAEELLEARAAAAVRRRAREAVERRSMVRGLLVLVAVVLVLSIARAGLGRVFVPGWWRQW